MDTTKCINDELWLRYSKGLLDAKEMVLLKEHVLACQICTDMKEGIDAMSQPAALEEKVNSLTERIKEKTRKRGIVLSLPLRNLIAAAAVLLVCFSLFYAWQLQPTQPELVLLKSDTLYLDSGFLTPPKTLAMETSPKEKEQVVRKYTPPAGQGQETEVLNAMSKESSSAAESVPASSDDAQVSNLESEEKSSKDAVIDKVEDVKPRAAYAASASPIMSGSKNKGLTQSEEVLRMASAKAFYNEKQYEQALKQLKHFESLTHSEFYPESQYMSALCYLKLDRIKEAQVCLEKLRYEPNPYKQQADSLFKTIGN